MSRYDDRLADYVDVKERVRLFYAAYPEGRLCTAEVRVTREPDDVPRVWVHALAYRAPDDIHPGDGWSWMVLPGSTPYTKGSEIENTETSAWGRAIGALGIGIDKAIASADEVRAKSGDKPEQADDGGYMGKLQVGDRPSSDFALRQSPDGPVIGFRLIAKGGSLVRCRGALAVQLDAFREAAIGATVTVWGRLTDVPASKDPPRRGYQIIEADRVSVPGVGVLPTDATPSMSHAPTAADAISTGTELTEAESEAIWAGLSGDAA